MYSMEGNMKKQTCFGNTTTTSSQALAMHKDSHRICKIKPKIRIIHIFAPEIIKTDVANFRELVQRLTGKSSENNTKKKPRRSPRKEEAISRGITKKIMSFRERVKGEGGDMMMWGGGGGGGDENINPSNGGFLGGFADLDGFMQQLNEFPILPLDANSSHMDIALGERERESTFA